MACAEPGSNPCQKNNMKDGVSMCLLAKSIGYAVCPETGKRVAGAPTQVMHGALQPTTGRTSFSGGPLPATAFLRGANRIFNRH